ncbi:MAG: hypothetical protein AAFR30_00585 [Cyanobacteria bacterium J06628_4]
MTPKEQLLKAIETTPDSLLVVVLDFLNFLKSRRRATADAILANMSDDSALPPQDLDFEDLAGIIKNPQPYTVSIEAMDQAIAKGVLDSL